MPIPKHLIGVKGDECQCGRRQTVRHCTACGSARIYGYANEQWHSRTNGTMIKTILFRCLACSHRFTDEEREWCEAPATTQALAIQRLRALRDASSSGEYLNAND